MPDSRLDTSKLSLAELFRPSEDFVRFIRQIAEHQLRFQRLAEPALRQAAAVAQIMRQPLSEPQQRQIAALARLYRDAQQSAPEWFERLSAAAVQLGQLTSNASKQIAKELNQRSRPHSLPPSQPPKPKDLAVREAVQALGDMPERQLWKAVKQLPGLSGTRRAQAIKARWAIFGHPPKGRPRKVPRKPANAPK